MKLSRFISLIAFSYLPVYSLIGPEYIDQISAIGSPSFIVNNGSTAFIGYGGTVGKIGVYDISQDSMITFKGALNLPTGSYTFVDPIGTPSGMFFNGTTAYVPIMYLDTTYGTTSFVQLLNIQTPATVSFLSNVSLPMPSPSYVSFLSNGTTAMVGNNFYDESAEEGFDINYFIDTTDLLNPVISGSVDIGSAQPSTSIISGSLAYVLCGYDPSIVVCDVSDVANPIVVSYGYPNSDSGPSNQIILNESDQVLYNLAQNTVATYDIADIFSGEISNLKMSSTSGATLTASASYIAVDGNLGFITNTALNTVGVIDFSIPSSPEFIGTFTSGGEGPCYIVLSNGLGYVLNGSSSGTSSIGYFDYSQGGVPELLGTITTGGIGPSNNFIIYNNTGYVPNFEAGNIGYFSVAYEQTLDPNNFVANSKAIVSILEALNGVSSTPYETQKIFNDLAEQPLATQQQQVVQLTPAFKVIQYSLEKLDLLLHKEVERNLYQIQADTNFFALFGYDNLTQNRKGLLSGYNGYNVDTPYQMIGFNQKYSDLKFIETLAVSESYMQLNPMHANAKYYTLWGDFGIAYHQKRVSLGLDALYGYSFIKTYRTIDYLAQTAFSDHGAYNISAVFRFSYDFLRDDSSVTPYDNISYIFGHENNYYERGALGANLKVKNENIHAFRNELGMKLKIPLVKYAYFMLDAAWLYDGFKKNQAYQAAFSGTDVFGSFKQIVPSKNYARFETGFVWTKKHLDFEIFYTGLYGPGFSESSGSFKMQYQY